eukprot:scaffold3808_cov112-Isochrysis_galbana.AAC.37
MVHRRDVWQQMVVTAHWEALALLPLAVGAAISHAARRTDHGSGRPACASPGWFMTSDMTSEISVGLSYSPHSERRRH